MYVFKPPQQFIIRKKIQNVDFSQILILGSVALLLHFTSSEVRFLDLVFLRSAGGPGNPCYGVQARNCKFRTSLVTLLLHFTSSEQVRKCKFLTSLQVKCEIYSCVLVHLK